MTVQMCTSKKIVKKQLANEQIWYNVVSIQVLKTFQLICKQCGIATIGGTEILY